MSVITIKNLLELSDSTESINVIFELLRGIVKSVIGIESSLDYEKNKNKI